MLDRGGISHFPKALVFDLDDTLWKGEVDCSGGPPFVTTSTPNTLKCSQGRPIRLFQDVLEIFAEIIHHPAEMHIAYASRTWEPEWAKSALAEFSVSSDHNMWSLCKAHGWGDVPKIHHFREIKKSLKGVEYSDMIFFDNDYHNITDIAKIGVHCVYCPDGLTRDIFANGLRSFRDNRINI